MDGLASLAAAADLIGGYEQSSPSKRRPTSNPETPKKKKTKISANSPEIPAIKSPAKGALKSPAKPRSPGGAKLLKSPGGAKSPMRPNSIAESPGRKTIEGLVSWDAASTNIPPVENYLGSELLLSSITKRFSAKVLQWCTYEWFYSSLDREYFNENEFENCLSSIGMDEDQLLCKAEWSTIRTIMGFQIGRPRRFSKSFVNGERRKLQEYRQTVRSLQIESSATAGDFSYDVPPPITVGDCVTAFHDDSGLLLRGQVLTLEASFPDNVPSYRVQFEYPVMFTGVIQDEDLAVHGEANISMLSATDLSGSVESVDANVVAEQDASKASVQPIDAKLKGEHVVTLHYFLDRKDTLLDSLRVLSDKYEGNIKTADEMGFVMNQQSFQEQRKWITKNIARTNVIISQLLAQADVAFDSDFKGIVDTRIQVEEVWSSEFNKISKEFDSIRAKAQALSNIPFHQTEDYKLPNEFLKTCACCLAMLKKFSTEDFFRPMELCECLEGKLRIFEDAVSVSIFIEKIGRICFGVD